MNKLPLILRALMKEQDITESELARRTGIGQPVIHRVLTGETDNPKVATLSPIANYFVISISQLIGDEPLPKNRISGSFKLSSFGWTSLPLLNWEQAIHWPNKSNELILEEKISTEIHVGENAFALRVKDTTMLPLFPEGTYLIIDPTVKAENKDFVIVQIAGQKQAVFRQLLLDGDNVYIKPVNPDFKMQLLDKKSKQLGVMVQARMNFK